MERFSFYFLLNSMLFTAGLVHSQSVINIATDVSSNYVSEWANGSNGGSGFNPWGFDGYDAAVDTAEIADSTISAGNINSAGVNGGAFRIASDNYLDVIRSFDSGRSLLAGDVFSFSMTLNYRNGNKGFDLRNAGNTLFNFNVGNDTYTFGGVNLSDTSGENWGYVSDGVYHLNFEFTSHLSMSAKIQRTSSSGSESFEIPNVALTGPVDNFKFYVSDTDDDSPQNSLYFNNLNITSTVPEPSVYGLVLGFIAAILVRFHRTRAN